MDRNSLLWLPKLKSPFRPSLPSVWPSVHHRPVRSRERAPQSPASSFYSFAPGRSSAPPRPVHVPPPPSPNGVTHQVITLTRRGSGRAGKGGQEERPMVRGGRRETGPEEAAAWRVPTTCTKQNKERASRQWKSVCWFGSVTASDCKTDRTRSRVALYLVCPDIAKNRPRRLGHRLFGVRMNSYFREQETGTKL